MVSQRDKAKLDFQKYARMFGVHLYVFEFIFPKKSDADTIMDIERNYPYRKCRITFYPIFFETSKDQQQIALLHEVMHLVTWELSQKRGAPPSDYDNIEESTMDKLAIGIYGIM